MAKTVKTPSGGPDPLIALTAEAREEIEALTPFIERSYLDLEAMEELGMDTSKLREKVDWAKKAQRIILDRLT